MSSFEDIFGRLSERAKRLLGELQKKDPKLAKLYLGIFFSFNDLEHPDRFGTAAFQARELMEALPKYLQLPVDKRGLGNKVDELNAKWEVFKKSKNFQKGWWPKKDVGPLKIFLETLTSFFNSYCKAAPKAKEVAQSILRGLDGQAPLLPPDIERQQIAEWMDLKKAFNKILHQERSTNEAEFSGLVTKLEGLLMPRIVPDTTAQLNDMNKLIEEAEMPSEHAGGEANA